MLVILYQKCFRLSFFGGGGGGGGGGEKIICRPVESGQWWKKDKI